MPIVVFLGLSVLDLGPMYATDRTDRQTSGVRRASSLNAPTLGRGIIIRGLQCCVQGLAATAFAGTAELATGRNGVDLLLKML